MFHRTLAAPLTRFLKGAGTISSVSPFCHFLGPQSMVFAQCIYNSHVLLHFLWSASPMISSVSSQWLCSRSQQDRHRRVCASDWWGCVSSVLGKEVWHKETVGPICLLSTSWSAWGHTGPQSEQMWPIWQVTVEFWKPMFENKYGTELVLVMKKSKTYLKLCFISILLETSPQNIHGEQVEDSSHLLRIFQWVYILKF